MTLKEYIIELAKTDRADGTEITNSKELIDHLKTIAPELAGGLVGSNAEACWMLYLTTVIKIDLNMN